MKRVRTISIIIIAAAAILAVAGTFLARAAWAQAPAQETHLPTWVTAAGFLSAALSVGLSCLGALYSESNDGSAAMGAMAEKPELAGRALIFVGLAEGIAIYGLIVAIMILGKLV